VAAQQCEEADVVAVDLAYEYPRDELQLGRAQHVRGQREQQFGQVVDVLEDEVQRLHLGLVPQGAGVLQRGPRRQAALEGVEFVQTLQIVGELLHVLTRQTAYHIFRYRQAYMHRHNTHTQTHEHARPRPRRPARGRILICRVCVPPGRQDRMRLRRRNITLITLMRKRAADRVVRRQDMKAHDFLQRSRLAQAFHVLRGEVLAHTRVKTKQNKTTVSCAARMVRMVHLHDCAKAIGNEAIHLEKSTKHGYFTSLSCTSAPIRRTGWRAHAQTAPFPSRVA
jgi:hypothetical protein